MTALKVIELSALGQSTRQISDVLMLSQTKVSTILEGINEHTKTELKAGTMITERLPIELIKSLALNSHLVQKVIEIERNTVDTRLKLSAISLIKELDEAKNILLSDSAGAGAAIQAVESFRVNNGQMKNTTCNHNHHSIDNIIQPFNYNNIITNDITSNNNENQRKDNENEGNNEEEREDL
jgi:hypothetical protein